MSSPGVGGQAEDRHRAPDFGEHDEGRGWAHGTGNDGKASGSASRSRITPFVNAPPNAESLVDRRIHLAPESPDDADNPHPRRPQMPGRGASPSSCNTHRRSLMTPDPRREVVPPRDPPVIACRRSEPHSRGTTEPFRAYNRSNPRLPCTTSIACRLTAYRRSSMPS